MPELPEAKRKQYIEKYRMPAYAADLLTTSRDKAEFFESSVSAVDVVRFPGLPEDLANVINGELTARTNDAGMLISRISIRPQDLAQLRLRVADGTVSGKIAKEILEAMWAGEGTADQIIEKRGLKQISDSGEIEKLVDAAIAAGAKQVEDYRAGKEKALQSLVGQVMKASKGKANPAQVNQILRRKLGG
jgi:aspartyl-tRNA(Asn)/glutamyl-tRNA(Gln) amidotransferase subunit B